MKSDREINREIAKLCGWFDLTTHFGHSRKDVDYGWHPEHHPKEKNYYETPLPDYVNDLNAMWKAEEDHLIGDDRGKYINELRIVVGNEWLAKYDSSWHPYRATARQRAEAFVKVMEGKA